MNEELAVDSPDEQPEMVSEQRDELLELLMQKIEEKSATVAEAVRLAAIPFEFNAETLRALRGMDDGLEEKILERLSTFSFVERRNELYTLSSAMRELLLQQWQARRAEFNAANQRMIQFLRAQLQRLQGTTVPEPPTGPSASVKQSLPTGVSPASSPPLQGIEQLQRDRLNLSILYHTLAVDGQAGIELLEDLMDEAEASYQLAAAEQIVTTAEAQRAYLSPGEQFYLDYQRARLDQLHRRWQSSRNRFQAILDAGASVPADLQARVRRDLGRSLSAQGNYVEAVKQQHIALSAFEQQRNQRESAHTMNALGETYMNLALNVWGGGEPFSADSSLLYRWGGRIFEPALVLLRLPILLYLAPNLGWRSVFASILTIGIGIDWVVARLFSTAARWFERAQRRFAAGDPGLSQVDENLGELHLSLKNPKTAISAWQRLLSESRSEMDLYRQARAQLGLANGLMQCERFDEASAILTQIEPIFQQYGHKRRQAQTQTLLAQCRLRQGEQAVAVETYQQALQSWQADRNLSEATDVFHQLEAADPVAAEAVEATLRQRRYRVRFQHPLLRLFQQGALLALVGVLLFTLLTAVHTESGTLVRSIPALIQPISPTGEDEFSPSVVISVSQQLQPALNADVLWEVIGATLGGYLLLYTLLGVFLLRRLSLQSIQEGERAEVIVDEEAITLERSAAHSIRLRWDAITTMVVQDRFRFGALGAIFSHTCLQGLDERGERQTITIKGVTNHYYALQQSIRKRIGPNAVIYNTGFSLSHTVSGWILSLALNVLLLFLILAQFDAFSAWLTRPLLFGYGLSDFYPFTYLTIGLLLVWWFVAEPLRGHLILYPDSDWIWAGIGLGVGFAVWALLWLVPVEETIERPDIVPTILSLMFLIPTTYHLWRTPRPDRDSETQRIVRWVVVSAAALLTLLLFWFAGRELLSFNAAVQGNFHRTQAESLRTQYRLMDAAKEFQAALTAYERSLQLRQDAAVVNSKAAILNRLGRYGQAVENYQQARALDPEEWIYSLNEALAYEQWATVVITPEKQIEYYLGAIQIYGELLGEEDSREPVFGQATPTPSIDILNVRLSRDKTNEIHLFRAGAYYALARRYAQLGQNNEAQTYYQRAYDDYNWLIENTQPSEAAYFSGRGYSQMFIKPEDYAAAGADFEQAIALDDRFVAAYTGLTWSHYFQIQGIDSCQAAPARGMDATTYLEHLQAAIAAISKAIELQPTSGTHYRTRAQLRYLLRNCPGFTAEEIYRQAIADYDQALLYRPQEFGWWFRQAMLRLALIALTNDLVEKQSEQSAAGTAFLKAAELNPTEGNYWLRAAYSYYTLAEGGADEDTAKLANNAQQLLTTSAATGADLAIARIGSKNDASALARLFLGAGDEERAIQAAQKGLAFDQSSFNSLIQLGWWAYESDQYAFSQRVSALAVEATPDFPRPYFNAGLAAVAAGQRDPALLWYEKGLQITAQLANRNTRDAAYDEAITDLSAVRADPAGLKEEILGRINEAR